MAKHKKISERELKKIQQNFECFVVDKDNQLHLLNTLVNKVSKKLPCVDVTNPSTLLDVAASPSTSTEEAALALLVFIILLTLLIISG